MAEQIDTANRYESLSRMHCDDDTTGNVSETDTANKKTNDPKPPPTSLYGVTVYKLWLETLPKLSTKKPTSPKHCLTIQ
jgi:hypothetical protein